ncbi:hypothetical protein CCMSSC00406_0009554 [Pleurotus cornucopiae]|uniref:Uncharacterized protein n=1 Tax=Pleurotus cornucopiae TaxID=5321 RepID=A0ACB7IRI7_PLECO|nr:hypothetical protein CCMSSC00406_0009554 [Pleurotus cornucopiae]
MATNAPLPLFTINPTSVAVATNVKLSEAYVAQLIKDAKTCPFFGFDVESMPSRQVRLVQIASRKTVYVFDINKIDGVSNIPHICAAYIEYVPQASQRLSSPSCETIRDAKALMHSDEVELAGAGELSRLHRMFDLSGATSGLQFSSCVALETLSKVWLGRGLNKDFQPAQEWNGELSDEHYTYAATDAAVGLAIYHSMMTVNILSTARPRLWIFSGYDTCSGETVGLVKDYAPYAATSTQCITSMEGSLAKMQKRLRDADETLPGDDFDTWSEKNMPEAVELCSSLAEAFVAYNKKMSERKR